MILAYSPSLEGGHRGRSLTQLVTAQPQTGKPEQMRPRYLLACCSSSSLDSYTTQSANTGNRAAHGDLSQWATRKIPYNSHAGQPDLDNTSLGLFPGDCILWQVDI